jgi:hypothetical protein
MLLSLTPWANQNIRPKHPDLSDFSVALFHIWHDRRLAELLPSGIISAQDFPNKQGEQIT